LLDALAALEKQRPGNEPPMRLLLLGRSTDGRVDLQAAIHERGLGQVVELGGQVPYAQALEAMSRADILLVLLAQGRKVSIPAKLFEYLGAARPILALAEADSDIAWVLRTSGMPHRIVAPLDVAAIQQAIVELRDELDGGQLALPAPAQLARFTRARVVENLAAHLNRIVAG
jgi:hypothetical protein